MTKTIVTVILGKNTDKNIIRGSMQVTNLKAYLIQVGMSMSEFAERVRYNPRYLSQIADGKMCPSERLSNDVFVATGGVINLGTRPKREKCVKNEQVGENQQT